jgi:nicotinamide-nucleotide amidase
MSKLIKLSQQVGELLTQKKLFITTAESCTGGQLAEILTAVPGSSAYFDRGFVTYSNTAKQEMLGIDIKLIEEFGAVSENTICAMAKGALTHSNAKVSIATSGIAGPGGGTAEKPVGLVWLAWGLLLKQQQSIEVKSKCYQFSGSRLEVRTQTVTIALQELLKIL